MVILYSIINKELIMKKNIQSKDESFHSEIPEKDNNLNSKLHDTEPSDSMPEDIENTDKIKYESSMWRYIFGKNPGVI